MIINCYCCANMKGSSEISISKEIEFRYFLNKMCAQPVIAAKVIIRGSNYFQRTDRPPKNLIKLPIL